MTAMSAPLAEPPSQSRVAPPVFVPPRTPVPERMPSPLAALRALRGDVLGLWPRAAYTDEVVSGRLFLKPFFLFNSVEAIQRILVDNFENYLRPPPTLRLLKPIVGDGLLLSEGESWRKQRRIVAPAFANPIVPILARHVATATREAIESLGGAGAVDLLAMAQQLALEIAARSMFSLDLGPLGAELRSTIESYRPKLGRPSVLDIVLPLATPSPRDVARRQFRSRWTRLMDQAIATRRIAPAADAPRDLFDLLKAARDPGSGQALSHEELRDQIATMILAGHETTALAIFWSAFLIAAAPDAQDRIAEEVRDLALDPDSVASALPRLAFTKAVVSEALRLYPPAFLIAREAAAADRCGGVAVPRGALVVISPWVLHRHQRRWEAPDAFRPSRFLGEPPPPRYAYMPFGAGPRVCIGAQFGLAEATLVVAMLVKAFEIHLADARPVIPAAVVSMQPSRPVPFHLIARRGGEARP